MKNRGLYIIYKIVAITALLFAITLTTFLSYELKTSMLMEINTTILIVGFILFAFTSSKSVNQLVKGNAIGVITPIRLFIASLSYLVPLIILVFIYFIVMNIIIALPLPSVITIISLFLFGFPVYLLVSLACIHLFCRYVYTKSFKLFLTDRETNAIIKLLKDWKLIVSIISFPICFMLVTGVTVGQVMLLASMQTAIGETVQLMPITFDFLLISGIMAAVLAIATLPFDYILFKSSSVFNNSNQ